MEETSGIPASVVSTTEGDIWLSQGTAASAAQSSVPTSSSSGQQQQIYVTVDTSLGTFPSMSLANFQLEFPPSTSVTTTTTTSGGLVVTSTKLDALANAASAQLPLDNSRGGVICGECNESFDSSQVFFQHWVTNHCRPQQQEQEAQVLEMPQLQQCLKCNHVFVCGTQRHAEHSIKCSADEEEGKLLKTTKRDRE